MSNSMVPPLAMLGVDWAAALGVLDVDDGVADGEGHLDREQAPTELRIAARPTAPLGESAPVAIEAAMALAGVVETVGEVEGEGDDDDQGQDHCCGGHGWNHGDSTDPGRALSPELGERSGAIR
jgi:hypothetical protein